MNQEQYLQELKEMNDQLQNEDRLDKLVLELLDFISHADFSNGNTAFGVDEGNVLAHNHIEDFIRRAAALVNLNKAADPKLSDYIRSRITCLQATSDIEVGDHVQLVRMDAPADELFQ
jgi:hypothetical protein